MACSLNLCLTTTSRPLTLAAPLTEDASEHGLDEVVILTGTLSQDGYFL